MPVVACGYLGRTRADPAFRAQIGIGRIPVRGKGAGDEMGRVMGVGGRGKGRRKNRAVLFAEVALAALVALSALAAWFALAALSVVLACVAVAAVAALAACSTFFAKGAPFSGTRGPNTSSPAPISAATWSHNASWSAKRAPKGVEPPSNTR